MSDPAPEVEAAAAPAVTTPKKAKATKKVAGEGAAKKSPKPKGEKKVASHPPTAQLVIDAVTKLNEKKGSSLIAIKKSIADSYKTVDIARLAPFIRKYLKSAVEKGTLVQVKGKGAMGSFKLAVKPKVVKAKKPAGEKKPRAKKVKAAGEGKVKKPAAKKAVKPKSPKKAASPKKAGAVKVKTVKAVAPKAAKPAPAVKVAKPKKAAEKKPKVAKAAAAKPKAVKTKLPKKLVAAKPAKKAASPKKVAAKK